MDFLCNHVYDEYGVCFECDHVRGTPEPLNQGRQKLIHLDKTTQLAIFDAWLNKNIQYFKQSENSWKKLRASAALRKAGIYRPNPVAENSEFCQNPKPAGKFETERDKQNGQEPKEND